MIPTHNETNNTNESCQQNNSPDMDCNGNIEHCPCGGTYYDAVCDQCGALNPEYE